MATFTSPRRSAACQWLLLLHLLLSPLLFCRGTLDSFEENKIALLTLTALTLAALGLTIWIERSALGAPRFSSLARLDPVTWGILLFAGSALLSTVCSVSPRTSWRGAVESHAGLVTALGYLVLFLATRVLCRTVTDGRRLLTVAVVASAAASAYALLQAAGHDPVGWSATSDYMGAVRPFAMLGHPNLLAAYLVMAWPLTVAFAERASRARHWFAVAMLGLVCLLAAAAVVAALSRAAWLAALAMLLLLLAGWWRGTRRGALTFALLLVVGCAAMVAAGLTSPALRTRLSDRIGHLTDSGARSYVWRAAWELFRERPVVGWGMDSFRLAFGHVRPPELARLEWNTTPTRAHNELLHVLATQGLVGGLAVLFLLGALGRAAWRASRRASVEDRPFVIAVVAGIAAFLVQDFFGFTTAGSGTLFVTFAALLSRWAEARGSELEAASLPASRMRTTLQVGGAAAVLIFLLNTGLAGWAAGFVVAGVGAFALLSLTRLETAGKPEESVVHPLVHPAGWRLLLIRSSIAAGTVAAAWLLAASPLLASAACKTGDRLLSEDVDGALRWYERAVTLDSGQGRGWARLGGAATKVAYQTPHLGERDVGLRRAGLAFKRAVELVPADPYAHANLARLLGEMVRLGLCPAERARAEWSFALDNDPRNVTFLAEAACTALALNDLPTARRFAERGIDLYPDYGPCRAALGLASFAEADFVHAERLLSDAVNAHWYGDDEGLSQALTALAATYLNLKRFDHARYEADLASQHQPTWPTPHLLLAQSLEGLKRPEEAATEYRRTLDLAPSHPTARAALQRLGERRSE
jgi:O-antigen ligase/tetratricopeptide (TPR) repeat protein